MPYEWMIGSWILFGVCFGILLVLYVFVEKGFYYEGLKGVRKVFGPLFWITLAGAVAISISWSVVNPPPPRPIPPTHQAQLQSLGLLGQHDVLSISQQASAPSSQISGQYFSMLGFGGGSLSGASNSDPDPKLQFFWERVYSEQNETLFSIVSYGMLHVVTDETKEMPTVEFLFYRDWLNSDAYTAYRIDSEINVNSLLADTQHAFRGIVVRISSSDQGKEIYLPKPK